MQDHIVAEEIYTEVAVPVPLHQTFTYRTRQDLRPGTRVIVPFGRRRLVGVVLRCDGKIQKPEIATKTIESIVDETPIYSESLLKLAQWISHYYIAPIGEVLKTMLPASATSQVKETYQISEKGQWALQQTRDGNDRSESLTLASSQSSPFEQGHVHSHHEELALLAHLFKNKKQLTAASLKKRLKEFPSESQGSKSANLESASLLKNLLSLNYVVLMKRQKDIKVRASKVVQRSVEADTVANGWPGGDGADMQPGEIEAKQFIAVTTGQATKPLSLTPLQERVYRKLITDLETPADKRPTAFLIHGVTGAGKTEIYMQLIDKVLQQSSVSRGENIDTKNVTGQSLVLVPEISLTPQMTRVFAARFPEQVAVVHSAMSDAERWQQLERIRHGQANILIGPRSAIFAPFRNLQLIIVDEEHDHSYKQTTGVPYHGRDVAVVRGKMEQAMVVLGSATPSMESYHNSMTGKYQLLELRERVTGRPLPAIDLIETQTKQHRKGELLKPQTADLFFQDGHDQVQTPKTSGDGDLLSEDLPDLPLEEPVIEALKQNLQEGHQAIVLVNRRGYAFYLFSLQRRKAVQCPQCSISLTLHARSTVLRCHYCDYSVSVQTLLREHPQESFVAIGYGSEKAEDCLKALFPNAKVKRLDSDIAAKKGVLQETLHAFKEQQLDILVGTQILAKGHDFPGVTLIVILEVDQVLGLPDFRAGERTFQLIVQAAGRAGRAHLPGKVLIQTLRVDHPVVRSAIQQDFTAFAKEELQFRKEHCYPPFYRMISVEFNSSDRRLLTKLSRQMEAWFTQMAGRHPQLLEQIRILGPAAPAIEIVRGRHRRTILFSAGQQEVLRKLVHQFLQAFDRLPGDVRLKIDVDPQSLI